MTGHHLGSHRRLACYTLQAESAHAIFTGQGDGLYDTRILRAPNGLPALPGTSIAGVLRHLCAISAEPGRRVEDLFGNAGGTHDQRSRVRVTWALAQNSRGQCPQGLARPDSGNSPVEHCLLSEQPLVRQRVSLSHRGTARENHLFDETLVPAGCRYTGFLELHADTREQLDADWALLMTALQHPLLRLGHGTRNGHGRMRCIELCSRAVDLASAEGLKLWQKRPRTRDEARESEWFDERPLASDAASAPMAHYRVALKAEDAWAVGGGQQKVKSDAANLAWRPQSEPVIQWSSDQKAELVQRLVLPATAVKGALAHRVAFHHRRLSGQWAHELLAAGGEPAPSQAVQTLFGFSDDEQEEARAGQLWLDDLHFALTREESSEADPVRVHLQHHNRIDRFTGGVMDGGLFSTESLWRTPMTLTLYCPDLPAETDPTLRRALECALDDLTQGRLPLGAGGSRGFGAMSGHWEAQHLPAVASAKPQTEESTA